MGQSSLKERMEKLERRNRVLSRAVAALGALLTVLVLGAAASATGAELVNEIRAKRLVLVDEQGRQRGRWEVNADGTTGLTVFDELGRPAASVAAGSNGVNGLVIFDAGEQRGRFVIAPGHGPAVTMLAKGGVETAFWALDGNGDPILRMSDRNVPNRKRALQLSITEGEMVLASLDEDGLMGFGLSTSREGQSSLLIGTKGKHGTASIGETAKGRSFVSVSNRDDTGMAILGVGKDGGSEVEMYESETGASRMKMKKVVSLGSGGTKGPRLNLKDRNGEVVFSAP